MAQLSHEVPHGEQTSSIHHQAFGMLPDPQTAMRNDICSKGHGRIELREYWTLSAPFRLCAVMPAVERTPNGGDGARRTPH